MTQSFGRKKLKIPEYWMKQTASNLLAEIWWRLHKLNIRVDSMDKKIKAIEKKTHGVEKSLKGLEKADKKRDKSVDAGKKAMKRGC